MSKSFVRYACCFGILTGLFVGGTLKANAQDPVTVIQAAVSVASTIKSFIGLFSSSDDHNAEIAADLKTLMDQDQKISQQLADVSNGIQAIDKEVQASAIQNQADWTTFFIAKLGGPVDALSTEMNAFSRLKSPSAKDIANHVRKVQQIYESFPPEIQAGVTYGNPVTSQLVLAILAEEKAGETIDPAKPTPHDAALIALRLQILNNRIGFLHQALDVTVQDSIGNLTVLRTTETQALGEQLDYVDQHYVNRELPWNVEVHNTTEGCPGFCSCAVTTTVSHTAYITGSKDAGYTLADHQSTQTKKDCHEHAPPPDHGGKFSVSPLQITLPGVPPQSAPDQHVDWNAYVAQYNDASNKYRSAKNERDELTPIRDSSKQAYDLLEVKFGALQKMCMSLRNVDCNSDVPHLLLGQSQ